jgi:hypothetical protein
LCEGHVSVSILTIHSIRDSYPRAGVSGNFDLRAGGIFLKFLTVLL